MPLKNGRTSAALQQILVGSVIPPGTIQSFGGGTVPDGWLLCDGSTANRSTYSALFDAIGTAHGSGDGVTTFHLPDLRGRFLRGADNMGTGAAGRDPGGRTNANAGGNIEGVGSVEADAMQGHKHGWRGNKTVALSGGSSQWVPRGNFTTGTDPEWSNNDGNIILNPYTDGSNGTPRTSGESRPQNAASLFIIKV